MNKTVDCHYGSSRFFSNQLNAKLLRKRYFEVIEEGVEDEFNQKTYIFRCENNSIKKY